MSKQLQFTILFTILLAVQILASPKAYAYRLCPLPPKCDGYSRGVDYINRAISRTAGQVTVVGARYNTLISRLSSRIVQKRADIVSSQNFKINRCQASYSQTINRYSGYYRNHNSSYGYSSNYYSSYQDRAQARLNICVNSARARASQASSNSESRYQLNIAAAQRNYQKRVEFLNQRTLRDQQRLQEAQSKLQTCMNFQQPQECVVTPIPTETAAPVATAG